MTVSLLHHRDCRRRLADSQHHVSPNDQEHCIRCCTSEWNGGSSSYHGRDMKDGFPALRPLKGFLPFAVMAGLCGCAQPALDITEPSARHEAAVAGVLESSPSPSRELARAEMTPAVNRVLPRVRRSAHRICVGLELPEERCRLMGTARVNVYTDSPRINAYADHRSNSRQPDRRCAKARSWRTAVPCAHDRRPGGGPGSWRCRRRAGSGPSGRGRGGHGPARTGRHGPPCQALPRARGRGLPVPEDEGPAGSRIRSRRQGMRS